MCESAPSLREREVMGMLAEGYTHAYIREALDVSDGTAKAHIAHVYAKLGMHRRDGLLGCIICWNTGLIKRKGLFPAEFRAQPLVAGFCLSCLRFRRALSGLAGLP